MHKTLEYQDIGFFLEEMSNTLHVPTYNNNRITALRERSFDLQQKENLNHQLFANLFFGERRGEEKWSYIISSASFTITFL